jgi:glycosyltransferase involved in cell wall biosynthesis
MKKKTSEDIKVSVIIPTKNEELRIRSCLEALANQKTNYTFEIIIVDTNSIDNTVKIAKRFSKHIIHEPIPGRNIARKTGSEAAKGQIICFTEADCIVPQNWIQTIVKTFEQYPDIIGVVGRYTYIHSSFFNETLRSICMPILDYYFRLMHGHFAFRASNCAITKRALTAIGGVSQKAREYDDVELSMRAASAGRIHYLPKLSVQTEDRRINGRLFQYMKEGLGNYYRTGIRKQYISQQTYADIR